MFQFRKQYHLKILFILPFLLWMAGCSKDEPTQSKSNNDVKNKVAGVVAYQDSIDLQLSRLFTEMDTTAALDSLRKVILADGDVESADVTEQGVLIEYKSGIIGGIFVDPQDDPDGTVFNIDKKSGNESLLHKVSVDTPSSVKTVFVNPHYTERVGYANAILELYNTEFPMLGYEAPDTYLDDAATVDVLANLGQYGIVHVYSHGFRYMKNGQLVEIFLMTGESVNDVTTAKYKAEIISGELPIIKDHENRPIYFVVPKFISDFNDFTNSKTIFYGGFCYSFLRSWPEKIITEAGAGAYVGFDWSVRTNWNAFWAQSLFSKMTDQSKTSPVTVNQWFGDTTIPKKYWNEKYTLWVSIAKKQADNKDMGMWTKRQPSFSRIGVMVQFDGHYSAQVNTPDTSYAYEYDSDGGSYSTHFDYMGSFSGNTFIGALDTTFGTVHYAGTVTAVLSADKRMINTLTWTETTTGANFETTLNYSGVNVPFDYAYSGTSIFQSQGADAGKSITSLSFVQTAPQGLSYSLQGWSTDWNSKVYVSLSTE